MPSSTDEFAIVRQQVSLRFADVRAFWSSAKNQAASPPQPQPFSYLAGSGFTIVFLYAALEFSITRGVKQLSQLITSYSVRTKDVCTPMMCLVHDPKINAVRDAGKKSRLEARLRLFRAVKSPDIAKVHDELLTAELQNVWFKSITDTFMMFGIDEYPLHDTASAAFIDRIVNDRNAVAHGRESPDVVGSRYTSGDIDILIGRIEGESQFIINKFSDFYMGRRFIHEGDRHRYLRREARAAAAAGG
jgi:hypothetical protein